MLELGAVGALPEAVALAKPLGVDLGGHRARPLTELDLGALDLVVGFERIHVQTAVIDGGARIERTFTLPELVALLEAVPEPSVAAGAAEQARARVAQAHALRPPTFRRDTVPEIRDPLGRSDAEQRRIATVVRDQVHDLARLLFS